MNQDFPDQEVLIEKRGHVGVVSLNRPAVLNALSLEMIREVATALHRWGKDDDIRAVVFKGEGERAFCAGGDVRSFYLAGMDSRKGLVDPRLPLVYFAEEYSLNKQIAEYSKPLVAIMNGITMGGGYGIAGHCDVRIATPETIWAMPEVGIGFFPDVGVMYLLHQCPSHYGRYLALTGQRLNGPQLVSAGLAELYTDASADAVIETVQAAAGGDIPAALNAAFGGQAPPLAHADVVSAAFADFDVEAILSRLDAGGSAFAAETAACIRRVSPTSVKVTAAYLEKSSGMPFDEVIATDFIIVQHFIRQADMYEGIRAQIIDKDRNPKWLPESLADVDEGKVNGYFTPTGYDLKDVQIF